MTTLPETNSSPLKIDGWKMILSFWVSAYFHGLWLLASGSVQVFLCPFWSPFDAANETHPGGLIFDVQTPGCKMSTSLWTLGSAGFFRNPHSKMLDIYKIIACFKDVLTSLPFWTDDIPLYPKNDEITWIKEVSRLIYSFWMNGTPQTTIMDSLEDHPRTWIRGQSTWHPK